VCLREPLASTAHPECASSNGKGWLRIAKSPLTALPPGFESQFALSQLTQMTRFTRSVPRFDQQRHKVLLGDIFIPD
jgi:hypothetical protein